MRAFLKSTLCRPRRVDLSLSPFAFRSTAAAMEEDSKDNEENPEATQLVFELIFWVVAFWKLSVNQKQMVGTQ